MAKIRVSLKEKSDHQGQLPSWIRKRDFELCWNFFWATKDNRLEFHGDRFGSD